MRRRRRLATKESSPDADEKPPYSMVKMVGQALMSLGPSTGADLQNFIKENYAFYRSVAL